MVRPQSSSPSFYNPSMTSETITSLTTREMMSTSISVLDDNNGQPNDPSTTYDIHTPIK